MIKKIIILIFSILIFNTTYAENIELKDFWNYSPYYSENINWNIRTFATRYKRAYVYDEKWNTIHYISWEHSWQVEIYIKLLNWDIVSIPNYTTWPTNNAQNHVSDIYYYHSDIDWLDLYTFYWWNTWYRCTSKTYIWFAENKLIIWQRSLKWNNSNCSTWTTHPLRYIDLDNPDLWVLDYTWNIPYSQLIAFQSWMLYQTTSNQYAYLSNNSIKNYSCNELLWVCQSQWWWETDYIINWYKVFSNWNDKSVISLDYTSNTTNLRWYFSQINQSWQSPILLEDKFINQYDFNTWEYSFIDISIVNSIWDFPNAKHSPLIQKNDLATYYTLWTKQYLNSENIFWDWTIDSWATVWEWTEIWTFSDQYINIEWTYCQIYNSDINPRLNCNWNLVKNWDGLTCIEWNKIEYSSTDENAFIYYDDETKIWDVEFYRCWYTNITQDNTNTDTNNDSTENNSTLIDTIKNLFWSSSDEINSLKNSLSWALDMWSNWFNIWSWWTSSITFNPWNNDYWELIWVNYEKQTCDMFNSDWSFAYYSNWSYDLSIDLTNILNLWFDDKIPFIDELLFIPNKILDFITNPLQNIFSVLRVFGWIWENTYCYFWTLQTIEFQKHIKIWTSFWWWEQLYIPWKLTIIDYLILFFIWLPLLIITVRILLY